MLFILIWLVNMSNKKFLNIIIDNSIELASKIDDTYYVNSMRQIMIDNYIDPDTKYRVGIDIINTYFYLKKQLMRYKDTLKHYRNEYATSNNNLDDNIKKMIKFQYSIGKHLNDAIEFISMFDIKSYRDKNNKNNKMIEFIDDEYIETFQELLENLENFKISQLDLYNADKFYLSRIYVDKHLDYENTFEKILERYIERVRWAEKEIMKIKYAKHTCIEYSLSDATENINNCIEEYNKIDQDGMKDSNILNDNLKIYTV